MPSPNIVVAIPAYGGIAPEHAYAVLRLQAHLQAQGTPVRVIQLLQTEISRARNRLAAQFLAVPEATHLLFIDSDIQFEPQTVDALLAADKPVVGCPYPKRYIDLDRLIEAARRLTDRAQIVASALDFVVVPGAEGAEVENGLCKVAGLGMGLCLIRREVFARLAATGAMGRDDDTPAVPGPVLGYFDQVERLSEDLSFCHRWRTLCGGEVWALIDHEVGHIGTMNFKARLLDAFLANAGPGPG
ncbi:MAG: hypothetical protein B7Y99_04315 [Caulobacterales bacterium 32-69-10]|nr:MAG: hypothetical protein B7Y99_04315 [Caulobacterales bacterium 32-69-10]